MLLFESEKINFTYSYHVVPGSYGANMSTRNDARTLKLELSLDVVDHIEPSQGVAICIGGLFPR